MLSQSFLFLRRHILHLEIQFDKNGEQVKTPPWHPSPNNAETVMKPLGKAMRIGYSQNQEEKKTLLSFLVNYRDTPHLAPAHMIF